MATIRKRGKRWQVQVRRKGQPPRSKSFLRLTDARQWARETERLADSGRLGVRSISTLTISDLLTTYLNKVTPKKRGARQEEYLIRRLQTGPLGNLLIPGLSPQPLAEYRDYRLKTVSPATIRREFSVLHHAFKVARNEWGWEIPDSPVPMIQLPNLGQPRTRRLAFEEESTLLQACFEARTPWLKPAVELALETAMRRGELLNARYDHISSALLHIPVTKTFVPRTLPLTPRALTIIKGLPRDISGYLIPTSANALRLSWERAKRRARIDDLRFHDLRHEAISRFFEMGLSIPEVALISGHRDYRMLARYTHLRPSEVGVKLREIATHKVPRVG